MAAAIYGKGDFSLSLRTYEWTSFALRLQSEPCLTMCHGWPRTLFTNLLRSTIEENHELAGDSRGLTIRSQITIERSFPAISGGAQFFLSVYKFPRKLERKTRFRECENITAICSRTFPSVGQNAITHVERGHVQKYIIKKP